MNRITLLFGANSSGKTSIIQALLLLNQTITEMTDPTTVLLPNGNLVSLGSFREFVHKHDINREIQIGMESDYDNTIYLSYCLQNDLMKLSSFKGIGKEWLTKNSKIKNWGRIQFHGKNTSSNQYKVSLINYNELFDELLSNTKINSDLMKELERRKEFSERTIKLLEGEEIPIEMKGSDEEEKNIYYKRMMKFLFNNIFTSIQEGEETQPQDEFKNLISYLSPQDFEFTTDLLKQISGKELIQVFDEAIKAIKKKKISKLLDFEEIMTINNPLMFRSNSIEPHKKMFNTDLKKDQTKKLIVTDVFRDYFKIPSMRESIEYTNSRINHQLSRILFLGPLRHEPERYYFFSGNIPSNVGKKGAKTAETLFYSQDIQDAVNKKLNELGIDYHINVTPVSGETKDIFSIRLLDQTLKTDLSISEVGFGISQILPIIVQSYLSKNNIICIEQPEIHIHPRLQTELAQLFYERINETKELQYIIETHSEHIILRFQRLIRKKQLKAQDISVIYVMKEKEGIICKELAMDQKGDFIDPWPEGFFEEAFRERFG
jgi:predicted ATP-dependent endonuclease of OLD family